MNEEEHGTQKAFYDECAALLLTTHDYRPWVGRSPNRWNNRNPGNGRFPGFGCVRMFGPTHIHVMLHTPVAVNRTARSVGEALGIIEAALRSGIHVERHAAVNERSASASPSAPTLGSAE